MQADCLVLDSNAKAGILPGNNLSSLYFDLLGPLLLVRTSVSKIAVNPSLSASHSSFLPMKYK